MYISVIFILKNENLNLEQFRQEFPQTLSESFPQSLPESFPTVFVGRVFIILLPIPDDQLDYLVEKANDFVLMHGK